MAALKKKAEANPHYVSRLIGPLALAYEMDDHGDVLDSINYLDDTQCGLVFDCLIRPNFERLSEPTKQEIEKALGYMVENPNCIPGLIEDKLLLCGVHPEVFELFIYKLWKSLFPSAISDAYSTEKYRLVNKPLTASQFVFSRQAGESLQDSFRNLHEKLLSSLKI
ncbi:hypothetical protein [Pseudomonas paralcaligenes]|uniref:hypothetical protein n=1 Tax=Pseudomonas paralcaligenes TaxID=2772558 RepID=UPI001C810553|nr:hypothetical protein [Pseudomonas paralcaligenes]